MTKFDEHVLTCITLLHTQQMELLRLINRQDDNIDFLRDRYIDMLEKQAAANT